MTVMKKNLIYCTNFYPGDLYSEKAFADPELHALSRYFDRSIILPLDDAGRAKGYADMLPDGITADWSLVEDRMQHSRLLKLIYIFHPFVLRSLRMMLGEARGLRQWVKGLYQAISTVATARVIRKVARRNNMHPDDTTLYSLWFHNSGAATAYLGEQEGYCVVVRGHTSDIYDDRMLFRSRRVRERLLDSIDAVLCISSRGREYLADRFPRHKDKFHVAHLGSPRLYTPGKHAATPERVELVTVARLDPVKRIDRIIDVLGLVADAKPDRQITYTVIGDGECLESLREKAAECKRPNLRIDFTGALANEDIQRRYADNAPDWYIMMSETEGIPISMCEAMSYGIPVITNDVGEITELVTPDCAIIFGKDITPRACADLIGDRIFDTSLRTRMGQSARARWQSEFNANEQAAKTARLISNL